MLTKLTPGPSYRLRKIKEFAFDETLKQIKMVAIFDDPTRQSAPNLRKFYRLTAKFAALAATDRDTHLDVRQRPQADRT